MKKLFGIMLMLGMGLYILSVLSFRQAGASRNSAGTMSIPNTFVAGTTISSTSVNANFSDIGTEITNSLERNGKGGMLAALRGIDGTVAAPAYSWTSETSTGYFRNGTNDLRLSIGGTAKGFWNTTGFGVGAAPTTVLEVDGTHVANKGIGYFKGIGGHGYVFTDTDTPTTKEAGFAIDKGGTNKWAMYVPANSSDLRFFDGGGADRLTLTSSAFTVAGTLNANAGLNISAGVGADQSGFKHKRFTGLCTTAASIGATCDDTVTWTTAFADANYTVTCVANGGTGLDTGSAVLKSVRSKIAAGITLRTMAITAGTASLPSADCIAVHD